MNVGPAEVGEDAVLVAEVAGTVAEGVDGALGLLLCVPAAAAGF